MLPGAGTAGAVYLLQQEGSLWVQKDTLVASDAAFGDYFGNSVAIDGNNILVGAYQKAGTGGYWAGAAYVYDVPDPTGLSLLALGGLAVIRKRWRK